MVYERSPEEKKKASERQQRYLQKKEQKYVDRINWLLQENTRLQQENISLRRDIEYSQLQPVELPPPRRSQTYNTPVSSPSPSIQTKQSIQPDAQPQPQMTKEEARGLSIEEINDYLNSPRTERDKNRKW